MVALTLTAVRKSGLIGNVCFGIPEENEALGRRLR
jgi:hypothetical protein